MKRISKSLILGGLLISIFSSQPTFAQGEMPGPGVPMGAAKPLTIGNPNKRLVRLDNIDGLPLVEVVKMLGEKFSEVNFIVPNDVRELPVNLFELRNVNLQEILRAMELSSKGKIRAQPVSESMVVFNSGPAGGPGERQAICRGFSLNRMLAGKSPEEVDAAMAELESALKQGWKMLQDYNQQDEKQPDMSFHRTTKLLIVVGTPDQIETVSQIVTELQLGVQPQPIGIGNDNRRGPDPMRGPGISNAPLAPVAPQAPIAPNAPVAPRAPRAPGAPAAPMAPKAPGAPKAPEPSTKPGEFNKKF